jgi:hypothetical protein
MYYMALGGVFAHIGHAGTGITWRRKYLERDVSISVMLGLLLVIIHHASPTFSRNISIYATQLSRVCAFFVSLASLTSSTYHLVPQHLMTSCVDASLAYRECVFSSIQLCLLQDGDRLMRRAFLLYLSAHLKTSLEFPEYI